MTHLRFASRVPRKIALLLGAGIFALAATAATAQEAGMPSQAEMWRLIQAQQKQLEAQAREIEALKRNPSRAAAPTAPATSAQAAPGDSEERIEKLETRVARTEEKVEATGGALEQALSGAEGWWNRTSIGAYGSMRFEASNADNQETGFTFRRFVLSGDSHPTDRLQTYLELEFERFTELELEKGVESDSGDEFAVSQEIEGSNGSEISIEQAWTRYMINPALNLDFGALLMPVGRFNINHDDNQWLLPRRSLVDRGAPVLPAEAAWTELGAGFSGTAQLGGGALLDYRLYGVNGVAVDFGIENELEVASGEGEDTELESVSEAEFGPSRGAFDHNDDSSLAWAGRVALKPAPGHEVALSGYAGDYVPSFLHRDETLWSLGFDGLHSLGGFELEYELVTTHFDNLKRVAGAFAERAVSQEREDNGEEEDGAFATHKIEFTLSDNVMAKQKTGYWVEIRRPFWIGALNDTVLGRGFSNPQLVPTFRMEQVFFNDQLQGIEFDDGELTGFDTRDAHVNRATLGFAYRPTPGWALQLAGEYTWTNQDSLAGLTNFLRTGATQRQTFSFLTGVAFGF